MSNDKTVPVREHYRIHHGLPRFVRFHWRAPRSTKNSTHISSLL
ncbi:MAG: hypothetical protein WCD70_16900 [Alphaproteobacteria bacterium]